MKTYRIAMIPGDGIGPEVLAEGKKVLEAVAKLDGSFRFAFTEFPWGCTYYLENGRMMPEDGLEILSGFDAIYLGAVKLSEYCTPESHEKRETPGRFYWGIDHETPQILPLIAQIDVQTVHRVDIAAGSLATVGEKGIRTEGVQIPSSLSFGFLRIPHLLPDILWQGIVIVFGVGKNLIDQFIGSTPNVQAATAAVLEKLPGIIPFRMLANQ